MNLNKMISIIKYKKNESKISSNKFGIKIKNAFLTLLIPFGFVISLVKRISFIIGFVLGYGYGVSIYSNSNDVSFMNSFFAMFHDVKKVLMAIVLGVVIGAVLKFFAKKLFYIYLHIYSSFTNSIDVNDFRIKEAKKENKIHKILSQYDSMDDYENDQMTKYKLTGNYFAR